MTMNNRLEILILNLPSEIYTTYIDVPSVLNFFARTGHINHFSVVAHKGNKVIFIEKIDPLTLAKELTAFQNQS